MTAAAALKVLVVDDQLTIRALVRNGLQQIGVCDIIEAVDGEDALRQMLNPPPPHLVICDYNMPKLDGLTLLRAIRSHAPIKAAAFILLSGCTDTEVVRRAAQYGANACIVKPFAVDHLRAKLQAVLGVLT